MFGFFRSRRPDTKGSSDEDTPFVNTNPVLVIVHDSQRFFRGSESTKWRSCFAGVVKSCQRGNGFTVMHGGMRFSDLRRGIVHTLSEHYLYNTFGTIVVHGRYDAVLRQSTTAEIKVGPGPELHVLSNDYTQTFAEDCRLNTAVGAENHSKPWLLAWEYFLESLTGVKIVDFRHTDEKYTMPNGKSLLVKHTQPVDEALEVETRFAQRLSDREIDELVDWQLRRGPNDMAAYAAAAALDLGTLAED